MALTRDEKARLSELKEKKDDLENEDNYVDEYESALDENGDLHIGNLSYAPSLVLKEVDPIAYRGGLLDYVDSILSDSREYQDVNDEIDTLQEKERTK